MPTQRTPFRSSVDLPGICAGLVIATSTLAVVGWLSGVDVLATFGSGNIPMAPSTAVLFVLFGVLVAARGRIRISDRRVRMARGLALLGLAVAAVLLVTSSLRITSSLETLGIELAGKVAGAPIGHMSPLTALGFLLTGLSFLPSLARRPSHPVWQWVALAGALALVLFSAVLIVAYALGGPILYGSGLIPPALNTSVAFLLLGTALTNATAQTISTARGGPFFRSTRIAVAFALSLTTATILIVSVAYAYFRVYENEYLSEAGRELAAVADLKADGIVQWRRERLGDATVLADNRAFAGLVRDLVDRRGVAGERTSLRAWMNNVRRAHGYAGLSLLAPDGRLLLAAPDSTPAPDSLPRADLARILAHRTPSFVDFHRSARSGVVYLGVGAPVFDGADGRRLLAVVYLRIDPEGYLYPFLRQWPSAGVKTARTLLLRREGARAVLLNGFGGNGRSLQDWVSLADTLVPSARAAMGHQGVVTGPNERGVPVEAALRAVPDSPWFIEARIERQEVLEPLRDRLWWVAGLTGLLFLVLGGVAAITWQDRERRHFRSLAQAEQRERALQARYRALFNSQRDAILVTDTGRHITNYNPAFEALFGYDSEEIVGRTAHLLYETPETAEEAGRLLEEHEDDPRWVHHTTYRRKDGSVFPAEVNIFKLRDADTAEHVGFVGILRDVTELRRAERERAELAEQLVQAQKLESVGRLAGGVAHDFNNMLSVILGHAELALDSTPAEAAVRDDLLEIQAAADRSAKLTRQLLAFARRQIIRPEPLDLGEGLGGMSKMLRRLIGENIELESRVEPELWTIKIDPVQLDQILANLVVNARDAISGTGRVTIEVGNVSIDSTYALQHPDATPGDFVVLTVSDDGKGMSREVMSHLFEPFFTTKPQGEGTGLGLATVYGIVRQNGGFANVYSDPGHGTTIRLYFPRHGDRVEMSDEDVERSLPGGKETLLVVEDEAALLRLTIRTLESLGYHVLAAAGPEDAIGLAREHREDIALLLTDVIMPRMNGKGLADRLREDIPKLSVLYMSGYAGHILGHVLEEGVDVIQKPFSRTLLALKIREALERRSP